MKTKIKAIASFISISLWVSYAPFAVATCNDVMTTRNSNAVPGAYDACTSLQDDIDAECKESRDMLNCTTRYVGTPRELPRYLTNIKSVANQLERCLISRWAIKELYTDNHASSPFRGHTNARNQAYNNYISCCAAYNILGSRSGKSIQPKDLNQIKALAKVKYERAMANARARNDDSQ